MNGKNSNIPKELEDALYHGQEEVYLEYKGDISWNTREKRLEIIKTILALSNEREGGIIVIGIDKNGKRIGLSEENYNSFSHDKLNQYLEGKTNQPISCKLSKFEIEDKIDNKLKKFVFIQVSEIREFPVIYIGPTELKNENEKAYLENIALRKGALYIRNKQHIGNKEISTTQEYQDLIERTYKKYERETIRRYSIIKRNKFDPYSKEITI